MTTPRLSKWWWFLYGIAVAILAVAMFLGTYGGLVAIFGKP